MEWSHLSKVELHLHLDCCLSYACAAQIDPSLTMEEYGTNFIAPAKCYDLHDFLSRVPRSLALMQTEEQLRLVTADLFAQLAAENVLYAEIRFAPLLHTERGLEAGEVVAIVETAVAEAVRDSGIEARLILCTLRHYSAVQSLETVQLVDQFRWSYVAGFDIAADEAGYPIDAHVAAFQYAHDRGIPCTAHAGEARGPDSVWETLHSFKPSRLGHGVRSIEDPLLLDHLRQQQIHLEVCPTCNIQTDIYDAYADHAIDTLYRSGLSLGVNTDARTISNISFCQVFVKLHHAFGWDSEHFYHCNRSALKAAFVAEDVRQQLLTRLFDGYQNML